MNTTEQKVTTMTRPEAVKFVKRQRGKGKTLFVSVGQHAQIFNDAEHVFPILANAEVTQRAAIRFLENAYSDVLTRRGAMVTITELGQCVFIGRAA